MNQLHKLADQIDRDIRNQGLFDNMRCLDRKQKLMVYFRRHLLRNTAHFLALAITVLWILACVTKLVHAEDAPKIPCPTAEPCKILILSQQEEKILTGQNGILDTAAQARALDLGQFAVYLKTRIASAPAGEAKPVEKPAEPPKP